MKESFLLPSRLSVGPGISPDFAFGSRAVTASRDYPISEENIFFLYGNMGNCHSQR